MLRQPSAQWLRDTANQFAHYLPLLSLDQELAALVKAVINNEARYVAEYPYCGSFQVGSGPYKVMPCLTPSLASSGVRALAFA
jgi:meiotically up-regulated gene 157 (Mug157) protein